jgi:hypothetical protein
VALFKAENEPREHEKETTNPIKGWMSTKWSWTAIKIRCNTKINRREQQVKGTYKTGGPAHRP